MRGQHLEPWGATILASTPEEIAVANHPDRPSSLIEHRNAVDPGFQHEPCDRGHGIPRRNGNGRRAHEIARAQTERVSRSACTGPRLVGNDRARSAWVSAIARRRPRRNAALSFPHRGDRAIVREHSLSCFSHSKFPRKHISVPRDRALGDHGKRGRISHFELYSSIERAVSNTTL